MKKDRKHKIKIKRKKKTQNTTKEAQAVIHHLVVATLHLPGHPHQVLQRIQDRKKEEKTKRTESQSKKSTYLMVTGKSKKREETAASRTNKKSKIKGTKIKDKDLEIKKGPNKTKGGQDLEITKKNISELHED